MLRSLLLAGAAAAAFPALAQTPAAPAQPTTVEGVTVTGFFQLNAFVIGTRLTPQGEREPAGTLNLGYRRKVNEKLSLLVTAQDVLGTFRDRLVIDTPV